MTIEERKAESYKYLEALEEDVETLKNNIAEARKIVEKIHTEEDIKKYSDFYLEKGLNKIELF